MATRKVPLAINEFYHVYQRGINKQPIFELDEDKTRFLLPILASQSLKRIANPSLLSLRYIKTRSFGFTQPIADDIATNRVVSLVSFCVMPNHFHIILQQLEDGGISQYMKRVLNSYAKYFNTKYDRSGHLFEKEFQAQHISSNTQLLHTSAYIHRNPRELKGWAGNESRYEWSSFPDYTSLNRWGPLLDQATLLDQFKDSTDYVSFVNTSPAKNGFE
ncbi:MAG: transposase [Candidatus Paceibacterota bacterium]